MDALASLGWTIASLVAIVGAYAMLSAVTLLFVRLPDDPGVSILEDAVLLATTPFVVAVVAATLLSRGGGR